jgi:leucyl-tRNA synthetase
MAKELYDHKSIEADARAKWESEETYKTDLNNTEKEPYYLLVEFPYPSGDLHTGHWYAYAMPDIYARYLRMIGKNVLFPIGFDSFGLPAENAAIKNKLDPRKWTYDNMDRMREQLKNMGSSFDWSKEVVTSDPEYYRWTQWLFSKLYEQGLAEHRNAAVKWCPHDMTVLANEQVIDGRCERCGHEVEEKNLTQWFMKITQYAKRLLDDLEPLPWREEIKEAQRAWIGESEGARIFFNVRTDLNADAGVIEVFTTRPDTIYGATYVVLAPEHPLVESLLPLATNRERVEEYRTATTRKTERERSENKDKTGVILEGVYAVNPATEVEVPVYVADYVLASYGTGAVMAVPAHDERDFEFAQKFNLDIKQVVVPQVTDHSNPPQEGKENTKRNVIIAIVHDPKTDTYMCLKWRKQPWTTFITGGVEEGKEVVEAARREIAEETGYTDIALSRVLGGVMESTFFAAHKDVNRLVRSTAILFELQSDAREEVSSEEAGAYDVLWLSKDEVQKAKLQHAEFDMIWHRIISGMDAYTGDGELINSEQFDGRNNREAMWEISEKIGGEKITNYRIRDWLVSRQRYWGCPIPIVYDPEGNAHLVPPEHLPWILPTDVDFTPTGKSPLATSKELQERVEGIFGKGWTPEYDTLDVFVDSSWYFTRYLDNHDSTEFSDPKLMKRWLPINRHAGGAEHTTVHLLYSRFFYKALYDLALVPTSEPYLERLNRGIILGPDGQKMSKSKGNVINPDELVAKYGADAVRTYLAFIGPYNEPGQYPWNLDGVESMRRFLDRIVRLREKVAVEFSAEPSAQLAKAFSKALKKVSVDIERFKFNTALSALMVYIRELESEPVISAESYGNFIKLIAPFAPHLAEHLWGEIKKSESDEKSSSIHTSAWPTADILFDDELATVIVQVNAKKRAEIQISREATEGEAIEAVSNIEAVQKQLSAGEVIKTIYIPGKILNFVIKV